MGWIIVWSFVLATEAGLEDHSHALGGALGYGFTTLEACEKMAAVAPYEPNLQVIEPRILDAIAEDFTCTWVDDYFDHAETP